MIKSISPIEAKRLIESNDSLQVIDVREQWEHSLVKLENSKLIPLRELPDWIGQFESTGSFLIYCHHGHRSFYACAYLLQHGFKDVYNLEGGIDAWSKDVDMNIPKY